MNWKNTGILLALAALVFAFIFFIERHFRPAGAEEEARLTTMRPLEVTNIVVRRTNQLVLRAERAGQRWNLSFPLSYPAQTIAVERLLKTIQELKSQAWISSQELSAARRTIAEFGLDVPQATVVLQHGGRRTELLVGARTAMGDQVYVQLFNSTGIHLVNAGLLELLPRSANDWRDTSLVSIADLAVHRLEVRAPGRGFEIAVDARTQRPFLTKPPPRARVSDEKFSQLFNKIVSAEVRQFVTDDPRVELEPYGLQPPVAELAFGRDTNDLVVVQFGKSPPKEPGLVYARRLSQTNIVLVSKAVLDAVLTSHADLRERRLLEFPQAAIPLIDTIEVGGAVEPFVARRQTNGLWVISEPQPMLADTSLVLGWLQHLSSLQGNVEKDVVTDLAPYGLAAPALKYSLKTTLTNANGGVTNRPLAGLDLGLSADGKIFGRGYDEAVYSISPADFEHLPTAAWQLRDRRVWTFTTNQVTRVTFHFEGQVRQLLRGPAGEWSFAPGSQGVISSQALEKLINQLGELRATVWVARGDELREHFGFTPKGQKLEIETKVGENARTLTLEFGGRSSAQNPYALAAADGQAWIFEFSVPLFYECARFTSSLFLPPRAAAP